MAAVEYPGYGVCRGSPSETSVKRAVVSAVSFIETELGFPPSYAAALQCPLLSSSRVSE